MGKKRSAGKRKAKKVSEAQNVMTKSIFLYGKPNHGKYDALVRMQHEYTNMINSYIEELADNITYLRQIMLNQAKSSELCEFEKTIRPQGTYSAMSQNAFKEAVTKLSLREHDIHVDMMKIVGGILSDSIALYCSVLEGRDRAYMDGLLRGLIELEENKKVPDQEKCDRYNKYRKELAAMSDEEFRYQTEEILLWSRYLREEHKVPVVKKAEVRIDTRLGHLERSENTSCPYVYCICDYGHKSAPKLEIPVNTSRNSLRRADQYGLSNSTSFTIREDGSIRVTVAFKKNTHVKSTFSKVSGVDAGIVDILHSSDNGHFGTLAKTLDFYKKEVETAYARLSKLRNKKARLKRYLRKHKNLPDEVRKHIIQKIDHIQASIDHCHKPQKLRNQFKAKVMKLIKDTIQEYIKAIDHDTLTAMELLDISYFKKSKTVNQMLSNFARGQLSRKLIETLNWYGYNYVQVSPEYTSQICPKCHHLDKASRDGKKFHCTCCGFEDDADHVGSVNIKERATDDEVQRICEKYRYKKIARQTALKKCYADRHNEYMSKMAQPA